MAQCDQNHLVQLGPHSNQFGDPAHGACNLKSTSWMSLYVFHLFQKLKDFTWRLGYMMKQIYNKHKEIWWAQANAREHMT